MVAKYRQNERIEAPIWMSWWHMALVVVRHALSKLSSVEFVICKQLVP